MEILREVECNFEIKRSIKCNLIKLLRNTNVI